MSTGRDQFEREFEAFLADEESRLAGVYRKLPQPEPDARLDAAVKAMAHRALNPQLVATPRSPRTRHRARWVPALGAAAGIVLAAGIAFRLQTGPAGSRNEVGAPSSEVIGIRQLDEPAAPPPLSPPPPSNEGAATRAPMPKAKPQPAFAGKVEAAAKSAPATRPESPALAATAPTPAGADEAAHNGRDAAASPMPFPEQDKAVEHGVSESEAMERRSQPAQGGPQGLHDRDLAEDRRKKQAQMQDRVGFGEHFSSQRHAQRDNGAAAAPAASAAAASPPPAARAPTAVAPSATARPVEATRPANAAQAQIETARAAGAGVATGSRETAGTAPRAAPAPLAKEAATTASPQQTLQEEAPRDRGYAAMPDNVPRERPSAPAGAAAPSAERGDNALARDAVEQKARASTDPNAHLYPEHWLANIRTMLRERHRDDALRSLAEFRRLYPEYHLPDDLRDLK